MPPGSPFKTAFGGRTMNVGYLAGTYYAPDSVRVSPVFVFEDPRPFVCSADWLLSIAFSA